MDYLILFILFMFATSGTTISPESVEGFMWAVCSVVILMGFFFSPAKVWLTGVFFLASGSAIRFLSPDRARELAVHGIDIESIVYHAISIVDVFTIAVLTITIVIQFLHRGHVFGPSVCQILTTSRAPKD